MKTFIRSSFAGRLAAGLLPLCVAGLLSTGVAQGQTIPIPNGDFNTGTGTLNGGLFGDTYTNATIGTASNWLATTSITGLVNLTAPTVNINGDLTVTDLLSASLASHNSVTVFNNNINATFETGKIYTLKVDFTSNAPLSATVLGQIGAGISLRANGADVANSIGNPSLISASVFNNTTNGSISISYTAASMYNGNNIGVSLFTGQGGLLAVSALGEISFDNLTLTAVPEPATWAVWCGIIGLVAVVIRRRRREA